MKTIEPIQAWVKGQSVTASILNLRPIGGELFKFSQFYYELLSEDKVMIANGNLILDGDDYQNWEQDDFPFEWAAGQLNLVITGDYVEPLQEVIEENNENILTEL